MDLRKIILTGCFVLVSALTVGCTKKALTVPGETLVTPYYAYNIMPMIKTYIELGVVEGCKDIEVKDTKVSNPPNGQNSEWVENWTVAACGKTLDVPIKFVENGDRVQSLIKSGEIAEK